MGKIKFAGMGVSIDCAASYLAPSGDASLQNVAPQTGGSFVLVSDTAALFGMP